MGTFQSACYHLSYSLYGDMNPQILYENYWGDGAVNSKSNSFSMAKSLTALAIGAAVTDGYIESVNDPVSKYLTGWDTDLAKDLTIYHLLTMTSNINYDESYGNPFGYMAKVYYGNDVRALSKPYKVVEKPGTSWEYLGGNTLLLAEIVEKVTGKSLADYFSEKIWTPLATEQPAYWTIDEKGIEKAYCCFYSNARDFAKFGQLLMNKGNWNGQQLIDTTFINQSIQPAILNNGSTENTYGYQIWLTNYQNMEMYFLRGILGQYVLVIPEKEMIVVRLGEGRSNEKINGHPKDVYQYIDAGLSLIN